MTGQRLAMCVWTLARAIYMHSARVFLIFIVHQDMHACHPQPPLTPPHSITMGLMQGACQWQPCQT